MIAFDRLCGWVLGELDPDVEAEVEEHLFECGACTATARWLLELRQSVAEVARAGTLRHVATPSLLAAIDAEGLPVRRYDIDPGQTVPCSADSTQVYALGVFHAALGEMTRVDAELIAPDDSVVERIRDAPFDARFGAVMLAETGDAVRASPTMLLRVRLIGWRDGVEQELGVYGLSHTASW